MNTPVVNRWPAFSLKFHHRCQMKGKKHQKSQASGNRLMRIAFFIGESFVFIIVFFMLNAQLQSWGFSFRYSLRMV